MYFFSVKTARYKCDFPSQPEEENSLFLFPVWPFFSAESVLPDKLLHENQPLLWSCPKDGLDVNL